MSVGIALIPSTKAPRLLVPVWGCHGLCRPRECALRHNPAFSKQRPESATDQNTTWHEWWCIALPKRIRTCCKLYEQEVPHVPATRVEYEASKCLVCSISPITIRSHAVYHFHITTGRIDDEPI